MGVVGKHLRRDVTRDAHDRGVASLRFGQFGDRVVPQIVEPQPGQRASDLADVGLTWDVSTGGPWSLQQPAGRAIDGAGQIAPSRAPTRLRARLVEMPSFTSKENEVIRQNPTRLLSFRSKC